LVLPDLFILLTSKFWTPFLTWLLTSVIAPLALAYTVNFSAASGTRRTAHKADPVTFAAAKLMITYAVVKASWTAPYFSRKVQVLVVDAIGEDILFAAGFLALIFGFYDAIIGRPARH